MVRLGYPKCPKDDPGIINSGGGHMYIYKPFLIVCDILIVWLRVVRFCPSLICFFCNDLVNFLILVSEKSEKTRIYIVGGSSQPTNPHP
jgi:hypothetical protein